MPHNKAFIADMHTHSEFSHDSVCKISDMVNSQINKGTSAMAVTDHCDIAFHDKYDIFTPIEKANDAVTLLNAESGDNFMLLRGVEISEGFWCPDALNKITSLCDYDVIIGSVHMVKHPGLSEPYSGINFGLQSEETIYAFLDTYFDDVTEMLKNPFFDILAHLTCPLRYINGKYKKNISIAPYEEKIDFILSDIINKKIALEVNTSAYIALNDFMPGYDIIKKYFDMGGRLITIASDAHIIENASANFDTALRALKEIGFSELYYYKNRVPIPYKI